MPLGDPRMVYSMQPRGRQLIEGKGGMGMCTQQSERVRSTSAITVRRHWHHLLRGGSGVKALGQDAVADGARDDGLEERRGVGDVERHVG